MFAVSIMQVYVNVLDVSVTMRSLLVVVMMIICVPMVVTQVGSYGSIEC